MSILHLPPADSSPSFRTRADRHTNRHALLLYASWLRPPRHKNIDTTADLGLSTPPPSQVLKTDLKLTSYPPLSPTMVRPPNHSAYPPLWLDHLYTVQLNRKRGAAKASLT